jgi:putative NADPH-quinone reductase
MKKLIIVAHPNPNGFAHHIAKTFAESSIKKGHEVETINLYDAEWKQDYLMLDHTNKPSEDPKKEKIQSRITRADELVFTFPLRRFDCPAILKNFLDVNFSSGFAYKYKK